MNYGIANKIGKVLDNEIEAILNLAWSKGIDTLDTAKAYGDSEKKIGEYLIGKPESNWNIITKISTNGITLSNQIKDSVAKLTRNPTIIMAHSAELFINKQFQNELANAKERQIISRVGVSLYNKDEIYQVLKSLIKPDVIQIPMNILDTRLYRNRTLSQLHNKGIEIHIRSAFLQGLFYLPKEMLDKSFSDAMPYLEKLEAIATESGLTLAELSLLWLISLEEVNKVIIGIDNAKQLQNHIQTLNKNVDASVFKKALSIHYDNENVLNPSQWD